MNRAPRRIRGMETKMTNHPNRSRHVAAFDGQQIELEHSRLGGDISVVLGILYRIGSAGEERVEFCRGKTGRDWYIWSAHRQTRLASYATRTELEAAWQDWLADAQDPRGKCAHNPVS